MSERNGSSGNVVVNNFFINHPAGECMRYRGMHVAWSLDGRTALAAAPRHQELLEKCNELGLIGGEYVSEYMPAE